MEDKIADNYFGLIRSLIGAFPILLTILFIGLTVSSALIQWSYYHVFGIDIQQFLGIRDYIEQSLLLWIAIGVFICLGLPLCILYVWYKIWGFSRNKNTSDKEIEKDANRAGIRKKKLGKRFSIYQNILAFAGYLWFILSFLVVERKPSYLIAAVAAMMFFIITQVYFKYILGFGNEDDPYFNIKWVMRFFGAVCFFWIYTTMIVMYVNYQSALSLKDPEVGNKSRYAVHLQKSVISGKLIGRTREAIFMIEQDRVVIISRGQILYEEHAFSPTIMEQILQ